MATTTIPIVSIINDPITLGIVAEYQRVFRSMEQDRADALMVSDETEHFAYRATIIELAAKGRIPTIYSYREFVEVG
jgi:putative tryptophan/tyrosine transport system substrate-binding protein